MVQAIYDEELAATTAEMLLQEDFINRPGMKYYMVSEYHKTIIVQYDTNTGKKFETELQENVKNAEEEVPKIESYRSEVRNEINKGVVTQIVVVVVAVAVVIGCIFLA